MPSAGSGGPPPFVGRADEFSRLRELVAVAASGTPCCALVTGLPGIGKTRLGREVLAFAAAAGFLTVASHSSAPARDTAYAPLVDALGPHLRSLDAASRLELVGGLAPLSLLFSGMDIPAVSPLGDPELERARITDAVTQLIDRMARMRPLALFIDDVHELDQSSLAVLHALVTILADRPVLLLLTGESGDPGTERFLRTVRGNGAPPWTAEHIELGPLGDEESVALLECVSGPTDNRLRQLAVQHCAGRPLFLEAMGRSVVDGKDFIRRAGRWSLRGARLPMPGGVRELLRSRLAALDGQALTVARALAVCGPTDVAALRAVASLPTDAVADSLSALNGRGMLRAEDADGRVALAHGLLRDAVLDGMSSILRRSLHADFAAILASADADDPRVSEHVLEAGVMIEPERALAAFRRAVANSARRGAMGDAVRYADAALERARHIDDPRLVATVQSELAGVLQGSGESQQARRHWNEALTTVERLEDPRAAAAIMRELALLEWEDGGLAAAIVLLDEAEDRLAGLPVSEDYGEVLHARVITAVRLGDSPAVGRLGRELRMLADRIGSPSLAVRASLAEAASAFASTDYVSAIRLCRLALDAARRSGDPLLEIRAHEQLSVSFAAVGDVPALRKHSRESLAVARAHGLKGPEAWARVRLAVADLLAGDADGALRETSDVLAFARTIGNDRGEVGAAAAHSWILTHLGRLSESRRVLDEIDRLRRTELAADRNVITTLELAQASLALAEGDPVRARSEGARLISLAPGWLPMFGIAALGEAAVHCDDEALLDEVITRLADVRSCPTPLPAAVTEWLRGIDALTGGEPRAAAPRFEAAAELFGHLELPFWRARSELGAAGALVGTSRERAAGFAAGALAAFDTLGATEPAREARALLTGLGISVSGHDAGHGQGAGRGRGVGGLSARELEVARLVATGRSNAQVATALFISPRTVTTHLDRIYARLGLGSRVALTRYLVDSGLLEDE